MWRILEHHRVSKHVSGAAPPGILQRYEKWKNVATQSGPQGLRAIKGFHDEALRGTWNGHRCSRLGLQWRVIYRVVPDAMLILVLEVNAHDYRKP